MTPTAVAATPNDPGTITSAIRPFRVDIPESPPHHRHALTGQGNRHGLLAGRAAGNDPEARPLLG
jgi:hypothetical protein